MSTERAQSTTLESMAIFNYAVGFVLAHEFAHAILHHETSYAHLSPWQDDVPMVKSSLALENEADLFAVALTHYTAEKYREIGHLYEEREYLLGVLGAIASIAMWEHSIFLRRAKTHPPAFDRYLNIHQNMPTLTGIIGNWRRRRYVRRASKGSILFDVLTGGIPARPLAQSDWSHALSNPLLSDVERHNVGVAAEYDKFMCGRSSVDWSHYSEKYGVETWVSEMPSNKSDLRRHLLSLHLPEEQVDHLLDQNRALSFPAAVSYLANAGALRSIDNNQTRNLAALDLIIKMSAHVMSDPWEW